MTSKFRRDYEYESTGNQNTSLWERRQSPPLKRWPVAAGDTVAVIGEPYELGNGKVLARLCLLNCSGQGFLVLEEQLLDEADWHEKGPAPASVALAILKDAVL